MNNNIDSCYISIQKLKFILILVLVLLTSNINAYDFEVDGLFYNIISNDQVEVTYKSYYDGYYKGNIEIPETISHNNQLYYVTAIGDYAFCSCTGLTGSLIIPNTVNKIGIRAFQECTGFNGTLTLPNSLITISEKAFQKCSGFTGTLTLPNSLESLGEHAFEGCRGFSDLIISNSLTTISNSAFGSCGFSGTLTIPNSVTSIGESAFGGCAFTGSLLIPNSVKSIGKSAFISCNGFTGTLTIPNSVTYIGESAFSDCNGFTGLLTIPNSVTYIGGSAFWNCHGFTGSLTIPNSVNEIRTATFANCAGFSGTMSIPNSITSIESDAFSGCSKINEVIIPNSVTSIKARAFKSCYQLKDVTSEILSPFSIEDNVFESISSESILHVPLGTKQKYQNFSGWTKNFNSLKEIGEVNSYSLTITSIGSGSAEYNNLSVRNETNTISIDEGVSATVTFTPDNGYRIKSLKVNGKEVTASTSYTVTVNTDTTVEVEFEAIPVTTYSLSISASGNGSASYGGETIRGTTKNYTVNEGTSATITFTPDDGYRIKSLKVDGRAVTASTSYTATVNSNTTLEVEFEAIPVTTYTLSISATGNGSASYGGETIRGTTKNYNVTEGTSATITFTPDDGYRIKSLKVDGSAVTASTSYTVTVNANTTVEVEYEEIPVNPSNYSLSITASGNGAVSYDGETIRGTTKTYTVTEGSSATITITPDNGYQIKSLKVNGTSVSATNSYSVTVNSDTTIEVEFEEIPETPDTPDTPTLYTLSIKVNGNGYVEYNGETIRDAVQSYSVNEGENVSLTFTPDSGNQVGSIIINGTSVVASGSYTISNIQEDTSVEVFFEETSESVVITINGVNYQIVSQDEHLLMLDVGDYGLSLEVPEKVESQGEEWTINGITGNALDNSEDLAAIIWNPQIPFTAKVTNPNLLLYVKDEAYAPASIRNVVVNGFAKTITLSDSQSGNNFYCPSSFTTQSIIYTHNYSMKTGLNESKGWETIALPFDVQQISHSSKGDIVPFAKWTSEDATKPFWLFELTGYGFIEADGIKANTPYIISMPNNEIYPSDYQLSGRVTFSALNAEVKKSDDIQTATFGNNTFVPAFTNYNAESGYYVLNVNNDFETYQGSANVGSKFILNLRRIHPFEAYMTSTSGTRSIEIFDGMTTSIRDVLDITDSQKTQKVYDLSGRLIMTGTSLESIRQELPAGVYIINNKKMIIK